MTITIMGYVLIPLSIVCLFLRPKYLLPLTIMFSGFTGSAVIILGGDLGIQPSYYFFLIWLISCLKGKLHIGNLKRQISSRKILLFFVLYASFSTVLPFLFNESGIMIMDVDGVVVPIGFSSSCITQLMYLWYAFIFMICLAVQIDKRKITIDGVKKYYLIGVGLVCGVTIYQIISFRMGLPFDALFRQNLHGNIQGARIYGPCIEASMLAYYLVTALPLCVRRKSIKSYLLLACVILLGVYSYSSTFLIGLGLWIFFEIILLIHTRRVKITFNRTLIVCLGIMATVIVAVKYSSYITNAFEKLLSTLASQNISGTERMESFKLLIDAFLKAPLTGIGFGMCRGKDLLSSWLAQVGLIGTGLFVVYLIMIIKQKCDFGVKLAILLVWISMFISVMEPYNFFIWALMAMIGNKMKKRSFDIGNNTGRALLALS